MRNVYFNHDGSVDDLVSLLLLLQMSDVHLTGVGVVGADSYLEPALAATRKVIDRFGHDTHLEVATVLVQIFLADLILVYWVPRNEGLRA